MMNYSKINLLTSILFVTGHFVAITKSVQLSILQVWPLTWEPTALMNSLTEVSMNLFFSSYDVIISPTMKLPKFEPIKKPNRNTENWLFFCSDCIAMELVYSFPVTLDSIDRAKWSTKSPHHMGFGCVSMCFVCVSKDELLLVQFNGHVLFLSLCFCCCCDMKLTFSLRWCNSSQWLWNYLWKLSVYGRISCVQIFWY